MSTSDEAWLDRFVARLCGLMPDLLTGEAAVAGLTRFSLDRHLVPEAAAAAWVRVRRQGIGGARSHGC